MLTRRGLALVLVCEVCCFACGESAPADSGEVVPGQALRVASSAGLAVGTVELDGDQIARGRNTFVVSFDPATTEIDAASTLMPVHGHGSLTPTLTKSTSGYTISDVVFNMPGLWQVRLDIGVDGKTDRLVFSADAP